MYTIHLLYNFLYIFELILNITIYKKRIIKYLIYTYIIKN
jgi:hypothetical protein